MQMNYLAKMDITNIRNLEVANSYKVTSYPTFLFFDNLEGNVAQREAKEPISGHTHESIKDYVLRYSGTDIPATGSSSCT